MTNEKLEKELKETQEAIKWLSDTTARLVDVLIVKGDIDSLDKSYMRGDLSKDEYIQKYKEQNSLDNLFNMMFQTTAFTDKKENHNDK